MISDQSIDQELLSLNLDEDNIEDDPYIWVHIDQHFTKFRLSECSYVSRDVIHLCACIFEMFHTPFPEESIILNVRKHAEKDF